jgi:hypothetical protein
MTKEDIKILRYKIIKGLDLAYQRLLISKQREDGDLVISHNGEVVKVKASELS